MRTCPVCKTEHREGDDQCPAKSAAERLGSAATIFDDPSVSPVGSAATVYDARSSATADPLIGKTLGHWTVMRRIGEGGMGIVYAAKEPLSGAQVAVKVLRLDDVQRIPEETFRQKCLEEAKERFRREAEVARRLGENQPHIVQILGYGTLDDGRPYFAMEFLYGCSLDARMRQDVPPTREELRRWFEQACDALSAIHDAGVVHRDLKPENIWICQPKTGKSLAKLLDFGISKVKGGTSLTTPGMIPGTALYLAPERLSGSSDDPRSDIYAMGVILHEVLGGRPPFDAETIQGLYKMILMDPPPPLQARAGLAVSPRMERLILECLSKDPAHRPQTAADLKARLLDAFDEGQGEVPARPAQALSPARPAQAPSPEPSARLAGPETQAVLHGLAKARRGRIGMVLGGAGVLLAGAVAAWMLSRPAPKPMPESAAPMVAPAPTAMVVPAVPGALAPSARGPDAGTNVIVRKAGSRPRPGQRGLAGPSPAALRSDPLTPPETSGLLSPAPAPSRPPTVPVAQPEPAPASDQVRPREGLPSRPSKLPKPSKADHDLITNEQILLGN